MTFVVYSRRGCHLCEELVERLLPLVRGRAEIEIRDIDGRADWQARYGTRIPVVEYDGEPVCQYHLDRDAILAILKNADA
ncbi:MAG: glutaredoxin family protein [Woeseiaceae bacterium]|nr:glutaredoxin family protein [Woeseiaceae bacterium]